eukprot:g1484.t1
MSMNFNPNAYFSPGGNRNTVDPNTMNSSNSNNRNTTVVGGNVNQMYQQNHNNTKSTTSSLKLSQSAVSAPVFNPSSISAPAFNPTARTTSGGPTNASQQQQQQMQKTMSTNGSLNHQTNTLSTSTLNGAGMSGAAPGGLDSVESAPAFIPFAERNNGIKNDNSSNSTLTGGGITGPQTSFNPNASSFGRTTTTTTETTTGNTPPSNITQNHQNQEEQSKLVPPAGTVPIYRNGCMYFVPENSEEYIAASGGEGHPQVEFRAKAFATGNNGLRPDEQPFKKNQVASTGGLTGGGGVGNAATDRRGGAGRRKNGHSATEMGKNEGGGGSKTKPPSLSHGYLRPPSHFVRPLKRNLRSLFIAEPLRLLYQRQAAKILMQISPDDAKYKEVPLEFHSLYPLEVSDSEAMNQQQQNQGTYHQPRASSLGYPNVVYKVISAKDSLPYALRRIDSVRNTSASVTSNAADMWARARHPNIVSLRQAFVWRKALFFIYDYHPSARNLYELYMSPESHISHPGLVPEKLIWSYVMQILSGLHKIHSAEMAARMVKPRRILVCAHNRLRLNSAGIMDVLECDSRRPLLELQRADLHDLGKLIINLCLRSEECTSHLKFLGSSRSHSHNFDHLGRSSTSSKTASDAKQHLAETKSSTTFAGAPSSSSSNASSGSEISGSASSGFSDFKSTLLGSSLDGSDWGIGPNSGSGNKDSAEHEVFLKEKKKVMDLIDRVDQLRTPPSNYQYGQQIRGEEMVPQYSQELQRFAVSLLLRPWTVYDICNALGNRMVTELSNVYGHADALDHQLSLECDNGRLFRLMLKMNMVCERPELRRNTQWAETGNRYVLKLFRDYIFHQLDVDGEPSKDMGHIVESLNKLDVGVPEKILLMSRDHKSMIVASFADMSACLEEAFQEIMQ